MNKVIRIDRENGPDFVFDGELIAEVFDPKTSMAVFKTSSRLEKNLFVCVLQKYEDERRAEVVRSHENIITFFGMSILSKKLYEKIGINKDYYIIDFTKWIKNIL